MLYRAINYTAISKKSVKCEVPLLPPLETSFGIRPKSVFTKITCVCLLPQVQTIHSYSGIICKFIITVTRTRIIMDSGENLVTALV